MKTEVCLTVDVEFSVGGAFGRPDLYEPIGEQSVLCNVNGRSEGLGCLLDILDKYRAKATFFVDTVQAVYFGAEPMGRIAECIARRGHDVQLHLHPCWMHFKNPVWRTTRFIHPSDSCAGRSDQELDDLLGHALEAFSLWGLPRPVSLRTGNFMADRAVYRAMHRAGLKIGSNVALGTGMPAIQAANGRHKVDDVVEVPCFAYQNPCFRCGGNPRWRHLSVTSTSLSEMKVLLRGARHAGIETLVLLMHPFELVKKDNFRYEKIRPNLVNRKRLSGLMEFVQNNPDEFTLATFGGCAAPWQSKEDSPSRTARTPISLALIRSAENFLNDRL